MGLGNPGSRYEDTRHNAGAWFVEELASSHTETLRLETKFNGLCARIALDGHDCRLLFPTTYMNNSGQAVIAMAKFFKIAPEEILVAHDELDLPIGQVKLKSGGGHAGHNGLRDIIAHLGSNNFQRLRIGISHPGHSAKVLDYVLGHAGRTERDKINSAIGAAISVLPTLVNGDFQKAMQTLHTKL